MFRNRFLWLIPFCLLLSTCLQENLLLNDFVGDTVFSIDATLDNQTLAFAGGQDGRYLFTDVQTLNDSTVRLSSSFADAQCPSCPNSMTFFWNIYPLDTNTFTNNLRLSYLTDSSGTSTVDSLFSVYFSPTFLSDNFTYSWELGSGSFGFYIGPNANKMYTQSDLGKVKLNMADGQSGGRYSVTIYPNLHNAPCTYETLTLQDDPSLPDSLLIASLTNNFTDNIFQWSTGSGEQSISIAQAETYCVTVQGQSGCSSVYCMTVDPKDTYGITEVPKIQYEVESLLFLSFLPYGIEIEYKDADGTVWTSKASQDPTAQFLIKNPTPNQENEKGQMTYLMDVEFDCLLYPTSGGSPKKLTGSGAIAFVVP